MPGLKLQQIHAANHGFTLIEVLIAIVIIAIGMLGLATLQATSLSNQMEAYQRAQALLLLEDMSNRIRSNALAARNGDYEVACADPTTSTAQRDLCAWQDAMVGASVKLDDKDIGSIIGATGCIDDIPGSADGEKHLRLSIAWQGLSPTSAPLLPCGTGLFGDDDSYRRVASLDIVMAKLVD